jgi:aminobenzoyl-glutamate utilization protein B
MRNLLVIVIVAPLLQVFAHAQAPERQAVLASIDTRARHYGDVALQIWGLAEVGYQEQKSSALLQEQLRSAGFTVKAGVAEIPTAFTAEWGSGQPVIAIVGEFDALPGLSQAAEPERRALQQEGAGHGCGHHLFGTASTAAAIAVKEWLTATRHGGTLRFYGTPAEEGGAGKVYMLRAGLFDDVDAVVTMHPGDRNAASASTNLANITGKFRFRGLSAHASAAPDRGRSALDGVEAMNAMVNLMREHVPSDARIHYVITNGGKAPNVVPDFAEVYYYARHNDMRVLDGIWERITNAARGAALGTGTTMELELTGAVWNVLPNSYLVGIMQKNLQSVGGFEYTPAERQFAETLRKSLEGDLPPIDSANQVFTPEPGIGGASTDLGDVSWRIPTVQLTAATWVPGTPAHSWQAVAAGGTSIGVKGMLVAAKSMALTAIDLFTDPSHLQQARAEFDKRRGPAFKYSDTPRGPQAGLGLSQVGSKHEGFKARRVQSTRGSKHEGSMTAIHRFVEQARRGELERVIGRLPSGWAVLGDPQILPGYFAVAARSRRCRPERASRRCAPGSSSRTWRGLETPFSKPPAPSG